MVAITLSDVSVDIPIYDIGASSFRKAVLSKTVGGRFAQAGTHIKVNALKYPADKARGSARTYSEL